MAALSTGRLLVPVVAVLDGRRVRRDPHRQDVAPGDGHDNRAGRAARTCLPSPVSTRCVDGTRGASGSASTRPAAGRPGRWCRRRSSTSPDRSCSPSRPATAALDPACRVIVASGTATTDTFALGLARRWRGASGDSPTRTGRHGRRVPVVAPRRRVPCRREASACACTGGPSWAPVVRGRPRPRRQTGRTASASSPASTTGSALPRSGSSAPTVSRWESSGSRTRSGWPRRPTSTWSRWPRRSPAMAKLMDYGKFKYESVLQALRGSPEPVARPDQGAEAPPQDRHARLRDQEAQRRTLSGRGRQGEGHDHVPRTRAVRPELGFRLLQWSSAATWRTWASSSPRRSRTAVT